MGDTWESLPYFHGERAFLSHIQEMHVGDGRWPEGHMKYRAGCVVSNVYPPDDDNWDLLLLKRDGISFADLNDYEESGLVPGLEDEGRLDLNPETSS